MCKIIFFFSLDPLTEVRTKGAYPLERSPKKDNLIHRNAPQASTR